MRLSIMAYRIEADSIGTKEVPVEAYYGVQSMRGTENFQITGQKMQPEFINSMAEIKKACAICNNMVGIARLLPRWIMTRLFNPTSVQFIRCPLTKIW